MRQRRLKDLDRKLEAYSGGIKINPKAVKGSWQEFFEKRQPVYMELGSGKGQFILKMAEEYPERNFIAAEGNRSVMLRALQKAERMFAKESAGHCSKAGKPESEEILKNDGDTVKESAGSTVLFSVGEKAALAADNYDTGKGNE